MENIPQEIPDIVIFEFDTFGDERGHFFESWRQSWFDELAPGKSFVQDNQSKSKKGTVRGLHYQLVKPQGKFLRVLSGRIYDVAVDLRKSSKFFGASFGTYLDAESKQAIWIPEGFAHGFYVVSEEAEIQYKCTNYYDKENERTLLWNDPDLNIQWPLKSNQIIISEKDSLGLPLNACEKYE